MFLTAAVFWKSGEIPSALIIWPRNLMVYFPNSHLSLFNVMPANWIRFSTALRFLSCSALLVLWTRIYCQLDIQHPEDI